MPSFEVVSFEPVKVGRLMSRGGVIGAKDAHMRLEELIPEVSEATSYGIYFKAFDIYYAAVERALSLSTKEGRKELRVGAIPGGNYLSASLPDIAHVPEINPLFEEMEGELGGNLDQRRPLVEVYHGLGEINLLAPTKKS